MPTSNSCGLVIVSAAVCAVLLAGCANQGGAGSGGGGSPHCSSIKQQLNKLDAEGVPAYVEAQSRGKKLPPAQKAKADNYNSLLNEYLGSKCHV